MNDLRTLTREEWLNKLANALRPVFADLGHPLPEKLRASCGYPSKGGLPRKAKGGTVRTLGQCWYHESSADGSVEIFVNPCASDAVEVARILTHELCHAANGKACGHRGEFVVVAKAVGFCKPWTQTPASAALLARLEALVAEIGPYPHATLEPAAIEASGGDKTQGTRLLKVACAECGYTLRTTKKWLAERGAPICPCNMQAMTAPDVEAEDPEAGDGEERQAA